MAYSYYPRTERPKRRENTVSQTSYNDYLRNFYSSTSEAYALPEPEVYPEYPEYPERRRPPQPRKRTQRNRRKKQRAKRSVHLEYVHSTEKERHMSFMSFVLIFFLFSGVLVSLLTVAAVSMKNIELNTLKADLKETKEIKESLLADLSQGVDLAQIEAVATQKLDMAKPEEYQIIEVTVPKQNYFIQYQGEAEVEPIKEGFESILELLNFEDSITPESSGR